MSISMRICTAEEMRELDRIADEKYSIPAEILMENAGRAAVQVLVTEYPEAGRKSEILVFAGKGNNAGDAFVVARRLICLDRKVRIFHLVKPEDYKGATKKNFEILQRMKARLVCLESKDDLEDFFESAQGEFFAIDGILGTGLKGDVSGIFYDAIEMINRKVEKIMALDIPSGVDGQTGAIRGTAIRAALTVSFGFPKLGHFLPPGAPLRGTLVNVDISLPPEFKREGDKFLLMRNPMRKLLVPRDNYGHKNTYGHILLVGGSPGKVGAITMAARASHKMGTGLVTVATWEDTLSGLQARLPDETMTLPIALHGSDFEKYQKKLEIFSSVVIGPGLGVREDGKELLDKLLLNYHGPLVIDADALNLIAKHKLTDVLQKRKAPTVLTPHPGEMARLLDTTREEVTKDPIGSIRKAIEKTRAVVVLKSAATLIGSTDDRLYLNHYPNDGMATAGSGDVLAGMIGGLLGQGFDPFEGTQLAVYLHSLAGDHAGKKRGQRSMTATDLIESIGDAFKDLNSAPETSFLLEGRARLL